MHVGYTGTMLCIDPELQMWSVLLSNRVYNCQGQACPSNMSEPVKVVERAFNNAIKDAVVKVSLRRNFVVNNKQNGS
jgi:CubicO group peptidase (beta-lactamase class C family)